MDAIPSSSRPPARPIPALSLPCLQLLPRQGECVINASSPPPAVELHGITKRFPGVVANKDIAITVRKGTVHALIGENGASTSRL